MGSPDGRTILYGALGAVEMAHSIRANGVWKERLNNQLVRVIPHQFGTG